MPEAIRATSVTMHFVFVSMASSFQTSPNSTSSLRCANMGKLKLPDLAEDAYLAGLLSGVADALENGVDDIIDHLGVSDEIKRAFQEPDTPLAESLTCIYRYERCAWDWVDAFSHKYRVSKDTLSSLYTSSAKYADTLLRSDGEGGAAPAP